MMGKVWFVPGGSRGFDRNWTEDALVRSDQVVATARQFTGVSHLRERFGDAVLPLAMNITVVAQVKRVVAQALTQFGTLDVVLNNAAYALF
jgi:NAD(P)-dependent dehydrogenase (short-subunit alcohol dehydrogenase family)